MLNVAGCVVRIFTTVVLTVGVMEPCGGGCEGDRMREEIGRENGCLGGWVRFAASPPRPPRT